MQAEEPCPLQHLVTTAKPISDVANTTMVLSDFFLQIPIRILESAQSTWN